MKKLSLAAATLVAATPLGAASASADTGAQVYARSCAMCHANAAGAPPKLGPNLAGVSGRKAGTAPGFRYSPAMTKAGTVWNAKTLDAYLAAPSATIPGNRMGFAGVKDPAQRTALVAYLASLK